MKRCLWSYFLAILGVILSISCKKEVSVLNDDVMLNLSFVSEKDSLKKYPIQELFDLYAYDRNLSFQSLMVDDQIIYTFDDGNRINQISNGVISKVILKKKTGHSNDVCADGNLIYIIGSSVLAKDSDRNLIYHYNMRTKSLKYERITKILDNIGKRCIGGICFVGENKDKLYLVTQDYEGTKNSEDARIGIYIHNLMTGDTSLSFEVEWSGWFIQGATCIENKLYVIANTLPHGDGTYSGLKLVIINLDKQEIEDNLITKGNFEPEGLDYRIHNKGIELIFGIARYKAISKICSIFITNANESLVQ